MMLDQELSDGGEIIGNHAPADPMFHADFTMRQATVQVAGASQLADAAFNSIAETLSGSKPGAFSAGGGGRTYSRVEKVRIPPVHKGVVASTGQKIGREVNRRLLDVQRISHNCHLSQESVERVVLPTLTAEGQRAPGLRFGVLRTMALPIFKASKVRCACPERHIWKVSALPPQNTVMEQG